MAKKKKDPSFYDATYILELKEICDELFAKKAFEVAFVAPEFHMRGDLVNELFGRTPIIVAHATNNPSYLWNKVDTPSDYEKITFTQGEGTTFWIHKDLIDLITALKGAPPSPISNGKKLRIFFPDMHGTFTQSMLTAMSALGHTLVLPGESFNPKSSSRRGHKLHQTAFYKKDPSHPFEVIENDEILSNPPDILCVNCIESSREVCRIWRHLKELGYSPKLMHYSGNNDVGYDTSFVKNLIATDA